MSVVNRHRHTFADSSGTHSMKDKNEILAGLAKRRRVLAVSLASILLLTNICEAGTYQLWWINCSHSQPTWRRFGITPESYGVNSNSFSQMTRLAAQLSQNDSDTYGVGTYSQPPNSNPCAGNNSDGSGSGSPPGGGGGTGSPTPEIRDAPAYLVWQKGNQQFREQLSGVYDYIGGQRRPVLSLIGNKLLTMRTQSRYAGTKFLYVEIPAYNKSYSIPSRYQPPQAEQQKDITGVTFKYRSRSGSWLFYFGQLYNSRPVAACSSSTATRWYREVINVVQQEHGVRLHGGNISQYITYKYQTYPGSSYRCQNGFVYLR